MKVCVTGYGIIDSLGAEPEECYNNYMSDKDFIAPIESGSIYNKGYWADDTQCILPKNTKLTALTRNCKLALHATYQALKMARCPETENVGVFFSHGPEHDALHPFYTNNIVPPRKRVNGLPGSVSALISQTYNFQGAAFGVNAACATGALTLDWAMQHLSKFDFAVVGAVESDLYWGVKLFGQIGALSPTNVSRPFDKNRDGMVLGEGAGCLIIEEESKAVARGAKIYATLYPVGFANDTSSITSPDKTGRGMIASMQKALDYANIDVSMINAVNAHATATQIGDVIEYEAMKTIGIKAPIYALKSKFGHLINAASTLELIYTIMFGVKGHTGYTFNLKDPISEDVNLITEKKTFNQKTSYTLNNSFGFGGRCSSQIIEVSYI